MYLKQGAGAVWAAGISAQVLNGEFQHIWVLVYVCILGFFPCFPPGTFMVIYLLTNSVEVFHL